MALFGKSSGESSLKRLRTDPQLPRGDVPALLDSVRNTLEFSVLEHPWMFSHPQKLVRQFALDQLLVPAPQELIAALIRELPGAAPEIRRDLAKIIAGAGPEMVGPLLNRLMRSKDIKDRESALELIGATPRFKEYLGHLKALLRDANSGIRQKTVRVLGRGVEDPTIFLMLRDLMHDEDDTVRYIVIEALSHHPTVDIIEPFFHRLSHESPETRTAMLRALRKLSRSHPAAVEKELLPILADEDSAVRDIAVRLLGELPDQPRVLRSFLLHLGGLAFWLRERSIESIQKSSGDLVPALAQLISDEDQVVRVGAMQMAGLTEDERLFRPVRDLFLSDRDWWERSLAADILGNFKTTQVTEVLLDRLDDPDLRYSVITVLGRQRNPMSAQALIGCLDDPSRGIRLTAMKALENLYTPEVVEAVRRAGLADPELDVRIQAAQTLRALKIDDEVLFDRLENVEPKAASSSDDDGIQLQMVNETLNA